MKLQALASIIALGTAVSVWATDGDDTKRDAKQTRAGVEALANNARPDVKQDIKRGIGALANIQQQRVESSHRDEVQPTEPKRSRSSKVPAEQGDTYTQDERGQTRSTSPAADRTRQFGGANRPLTANQWGGFVPPNQWGFIPNGAVNLNQVNGFRTFGFPNGFASGGFGYGYGNPYLVPNYYGFGFSPIVFGLSGPVVVRYNDPLRRQWKLVDDGVRKMAEGK